MRSQKFHEYASISSINVSLVCEHNFFCRSVRVCLSKVKLWQSTRLSFIYQFGMQFRAVFSGASWPNQCFISQSFFFAVVVVDTCVSECMWLRVCNNKEHDKRDFIGHVLPVLLLLLLLLFSSNFMLIISIKYVNQSNFDCIWMH